MQDIIKKTQEIAYQHLASFGFEEEDIHPLIAQATKDLEENLSTLQHQLHADPVDKEGMGNTLHALKGLLFQLGNRAVAEQINELRMDLDSSESIDTITRLLLVE